MNAEGKTEADARDPEKAKEMRDPMNVTAAFPMPQGQFLYDVRKKIGLLDPLHLIMYRIHATSVHYICFLGTPSPTHCGRHMCMLPRAPTSAARWPRTGRRPTRRWRPAQTSLTTPREAIQLWSHFPVENLATRWRGEIRRLIKDKKNLGTGLSSYSDTLNFTSPPGVR